VDTVFLDASVLFSAAYRSGALVAKLWGLQSVQLISSAYAVDEANRNLDSDAQRTRLGELVTPMRIVAAGVITPLDVSQAAQALHLRRVEPPPPPC